MLKLDDNPPIMYPEDQMPSGVAGVWWVGHTKARNEKALAWELRGKGIAYFLPMVERVIFSGGRKRRGMSPLFPGYLFFCGDEMARYTAMTTNRLAQTIEVKDQPLLVRELTHLHQAIKAGMSLDPYPELAVGSRCRVKAGPMLGIEGTLIRRDGVTRLALNVSLLGQGAELQIEPELVEAIDVG